MQDVDVLILNSEYDQETIKWMMTVHNKCFYLEIPSTPDADWKRLSYHPQGSTADTKGINIDILVPPSAELPLFDPYWINCNNEHGLPAAPLLLVLLHKVLGWWKNVNSSDYHYKKHQKDADDVEYLVPLASRMGVTIGNDILPDTFIDSARQWVNEFMARYPNDRMMYHWGNIGFHMQNNRRMGRVIGGGERVVADPDCATAEGEERAYLGIYYVAAVEELDGNWA